MKLQMKETPNFYTEFRVRYGNKKRNQNLRLIYKNCIYASHLEIFPTWFILLT
jgi:hypothetical protein